jgi:hypothetical protein
VDVHHASPIQHRRVVAIITLVHKPKCRREFFPLAALLQARVFRANGPSPITRIYARRVSQMHTTPFRSALHCRLITIVSYRQTTVIARFTLHMCTPRHQLKEQSIPRNYVNYVMQIFLACTKGFRFRDISFATPIIDCRRGPPVTPKDQRYQIILTGIHLPFCMALSCYIFSKTKTTYCNSTLSFPLFSFSSHSFSPNTPTPTTLSSRPTHSLENEQRLGAHVDVCLLCNEHYSERV